MASETNDHIRTETVGRVRVVSLDRPSKKNALTLRMYDALTKALLVADEDPAVSVVLLKGEGGSFTAGNDLVDFMSAPPSGTDSPAFRLLFQLTNQQKPIIAAVDGHAVGIGTTLLLHCDIVYASDRARFQIPFVKLGLCPEGGSSLLLPHVVGSQRAAEWLMFCEPIDAAAAKEAGLVRAVLPADELVAFAQERAKSLSDKPLASLILTKKLLRDPLRQAVQETIAREGAHFVERLASEEAQAAFAAFFNKG